jgi:indolepyruvate ferredoxin oxidoreductase
LSGVQALVRLVVDQMRADASAGARTASFISGYPGSPLGGLDKELAREQALLKEHEIVHVPGLNEELAATACWGSQVARRFGAPYDGILSAWYGKAPGLDRAGDALRHANWVGTGRLSGALCIVGDDPVAKSSTIPSASESALADFGMPVFFPGSLQEILDLGRHAIACSRASGLWSGLKIVTNVADSTATVEVGLDRVRIPVPRPLLADGSTNQHDPHGHLLPPHTLELERAFWDVRVETARRYIASNDVNYVEGSGDAWLGHRGQAIFRPDADVA